MTTNLILLPLSTDLSGSLYGFTNTVNILEWFFDFVLCLKTLNELTLITNPVLVRLLVRHIWAHYVQFRLEALRRRSVSRMEHNLSHRSLLSYSSSHHFSAVRNIGTLQLGRKPICKRRPVQYGKEK